MQIEEDNCLVLIAAVLIDSQFEPLLAHHSVLWLHFAYVFHLVAMTLFFFIIEGRLDFILLLFQAIQGVGELFDVLIYLKLKLLFITDSYSIFFLNAYFISIQVNIFIK